MWADLDATERNKFNIRTDIYGRIIRGEKPEGNILSCNGDILEKNDVYANLIIAFCDIVFDNSVVDNYMSYGGIRLYDIFDLTFFCMNIFYPISTKLATYMQTILDAL